MAESTASPRSYGSKQLLCISVYFLEQEAEYVTNYKTNKTLTGVQVSPKTYLTDHKFVLTMIDGEVSMLKRG